MPRNGFTLVELMVAISVMALFAAAVVFVAVPQESPANAASRFASRIAAARDTSILTGQPVSAWVSPSGYGFHQLREGYWQQLDQKPFESNDWGRDVTVAFEDSANGRVRVRFDSLGMPDRPLTLRIASAHRAARVSLTANGDISVK